MRICAALCWFNEPIEFLDRCVRSLEGVVDELLALDGAWRYQPGGTPLSHPREVKAIREAAEEIALDVRVTSGFDIFESQVHKRERLMDLAAEDAEWVLVIDGDEYVTYSEPGTIRRDLTETEALCGYVAWKNLNRGETMPGTTPTSGLNRRLFRAGTTVRIVHSGYFYKGRNVLVEDDSLDLRHCLAMEHDNVNRGVERNAQARSYRRARAAHSVESWVAA